MAIKKRPTQKPSDDDSEDEILSEECNPFPTTFDDEEDGAEREKLMIGSKMVISGESDEEEVLDPTEENHEQEEEGSQSEPEDKAEEDSEGDEEEDTPLKINIGSDDSSDSSSESSDSSDAESDISSIASDDSDRYMDTFAVEAETSSDEEEDDYSSRKDRLSKSKSSSNLGLSQEIDENSQFSQLDLNGSTNGFEDEESDEEVERAIEEKSCRWWWSVYSENGYTLEDVAGRISSGDTSLYSRFKTKWMCSGCKDQRRCVKSWIKEEWLTKRAEHRQYILRNSKNAEPNGTSSNSRSQMAMVQRRNETSARLPGPIANSEELEEGDQTYRQNLAEPVDDNEPVMGINADHINLFLCRVKDLIQKKKQEKYPDMHKFTGSFMINP